MASIFGNDLWWNLMIQYDWLLIEEDFMRWQHYWDQQEEMYREYSRGDYDEYH